jgi:retron-type reverse transcriptase
MRSTGIHPVGSDVQTGRPHKAFSTEKIMTSEERKQARYQRRKAERDGKKQSFFSKYDDFSLITDPNNLYASFNKSKRGVSWKESVQRYEANVLVNIAETIQKLNGGESVSCGFAEFDLNERGKVRHIKSIHISERIVQKCLCDQVLVPIMSRPLIYDNGASLKNKGLHFSIRRLITHLSKYFRHYKTNEGYCLEVDFSKYFDSIRHDILFNAIQKYIKDEQIIKLLYDFITPFGGGVSLGLGSQVSQISAIFHASPLDHYIKEKCRIKYYGRYMDDLYLLHPSKDYLIKCLEGIKKICEQLGIAINTRKTRITKLKDGVHFLKGVYTLNSIGKVIRRANPESRKRIRRKLKKFKNLVETGHMTQNDVYTAYQSWRGNYRRRFHAYHTIKRMDGLYNRLFIDDRRV